MKYYTQLHKLYRLTRRVCLTGLLLLQVLHLAAQTITTIAGNSSPGEGDGGPANDANLRYPTGIAIDGNGNLFIADQDNHRIRKVDSNGIITTVAGTGNAGFSGDGGAATDAMLNKPMGIAVDKSGTLFITDSYNQRIRKVDTNGIITTIAGNGTVGYSGNNVQATSAQLNYPTMTAIDRIGNVFIADPINYSVRKVSPTGIITTVAGMGVQAFGSADGGTAASTPLAYPFGITIDANNDLLILDELDQRIRKVDANGIITTVAGSNTSGTTGFSGDGGAATMAKLAYPSGAIVDGNGNLFFLDEGNLRVRKVDTNGIITTVAGNGTGGGRGDGGPATQASFNMLAAITIDSQGNLYVADRKNLCVRKIDTNGIITTYAGNGTESYGGDGRVGSLARLNMPTKAAVDKNGNVFIADAQNNRIRKVDTNGIITTYAGTSPSGFGGDGGAATLAPLNNPVAVAVDNQGNLFIADASNRRVRKVDVNGIISTVAGTGQFGYTGDGGPATSATFATLTSLALDRYGNLFIGDQAAYCVRKVDANGIITTIAGSGNYGSDGDGGAATKAKLASAVGLAIDDQSSLFIADIYADRVRKVDSNGIITTVVGNGTVGFGGDGGAATAAILNSPADVAVDNQGSLYIADRNNQRIRKVAANGIITTIAGNGGFGFSGDGGPALAASFNNPSGLAVDANCNLFIVDLGNQHVRKVSTIPSVGKAIVSVQSGDWLTASTWDCNCVPSNSDTATISAGHNVTVSQTVQISTLIMNGHLQYTVGGKVSF